MGKHGPCCHCGVTSTPLWRNGPADKPILCNACGSRWRTKGSLTNYTPLHARAEPEDYEVNKHPRAKTVSINKQKEPKFLRRKQLFESEGRSTGGSFCDNPSFSNFLEQDASNRSSSGSVISNSGSCGRFSKFEANELTDLDKSIAWNSVVTPKKNIIIPRSKLSPVQKLTRELCTILHEQQSYFSESSEQDLLFDTSETMPSVEIGHGSILIKDPRIIGQDDSEASSLAFDSKQYLGQPSYISANNLLVNVRSKEPRTYISEVENSRKSPDLEMQQEQIKRDRLQNEKLQILGNHNSPLCTINLKDVLNVKEFKTHLTMEERQRLMKYLPFTDTSACPDSLISMFDSANFMENVSSFQHLLAEGVFDISLSGVMAEDCKTLRRFALSNLTKSKWVEHYNLLKKGKDCTAYVVPGISNALKTGKTANVKRPRDETYTEIPDATSTMKYPKRDSFEVDENKAPFNNTASCVSVENMDENKAKLSKTASCFSPVSLFDMTPNSSSYTTDSFQYDDDNPEEDLLLDVTVNNSFPQAEFLHPTSSYQAFLTIPCSRATNPHP